MAAGGRRIVEGAALALSVLVGLTTVAAAPTAVPAGAAPSTPPGAEWGVASRAHPFPASPEGTQISSSWLSRLTAALGTVHPAKVVLSPTDPTLSYANAQMTENTEAVVRADLSMLESTGAQGVTVDLGYEPWLTGDTAAIAEDTAMIDQIRKSGKLLVLKDASSESYRTHPLPWTTFANAWVARVRALAALYHPAYYTVIKEPGWYLPMIAGLSRTLHSPADAQILNPTTWITLLKRLIKAVHSVSPSTKIGVSIPGDSLYHGTVSIYPKFMAEVSETPGVSFLGFDIYDEAAFADTYRFLHTTNIHGRAVWINEAWSTTTPGPASNPDRSSLDAQWIRVLYKYALAIGAEGVSPFYTDCFAGYGTRPSTPTALVRFYAGRTPVYRAFVGLVSAERAGRA